MPDLPPAAWASACKDWDKWDKPAPPFRVYGSTFHVGTCGISAILIADPEGHILIDSGTAGGTPEVLANIGELGFETERAFAFVLHSHEHHDHVGGFSLLQEAMPEARYAASQVAANVLRSGRVDARDPQASSHEAMAPARVDRIVSDGDVLKVGHHEVRAFATPGHTPGALSWQWEECEGDDCKSIAYVDSLSAVSADSYRFSDHPEYVATFRASIAKVAALNCDILLTPHPSASRMRDKLVAGDLGSGMDCKAYAAAQLGRLEKRLAKEAQGATP